MFSFVYFTEALDQNDVSCLGSHGTQCTHFTNSSGSQNKGRSPLWIPGLFQVKERGTARQINERTSINLRSDLAEFLTKLNLGSEDWVVQIPELPRNQLSHVSFISQLFKPERRPREKSLKVALILLLLFSDDSQTCSDSVDIVHNLQQHLILRELS